MFSLNKAISLLFYITSTLNLILFAKTVTLSNISAYIPYIVSLIFEKIATLTRFVDTDCSVKLFDLAQLLGVYVLIYGCPYRMLKF